MSVGVNSRLLDIQHGLPDASARIDHVVVRYTCGSERLGGRSSQVLQPLNTETVEFYY